jgi:hypothetical protein
LVEEMERPMTRAHVLCLSLLIASACGDDDGVDDEVTEDGGVRDTGTGDRDLGADPTDADTDTDLGSTEDMGEDDGGSDVDAGPDDAGSSAGTIECMGSTCEAATEECCITGGAGGAMAMCIPAGDTCTGGTATCDGPEDCGGGEVCCATREGLGGVSAACTTDACGGGFTSFELCHDAADCSDSSHMCCPVMMFGFSGAYCAASCGFAP